MMSVRSFAATMLACVTGCVIPLRTGEDALTLAPKVVTQKVMPDTIRRLRGVSWGGVRD